MCGIVGVIGKFTRLDDKLIKSLLHMDIIRGKDSTGVFSVDNQDEIVWHKSLELPMEFCDSKAYNQVLQNAVGGQGIIGHNRAATLGKITKENAHPFYQEGIIGVHNGTLHELPQVDRTFDTDSETIMYDLSQRTAKEVVESLDGAFALVWFNQNESKWYVCRNNERPLHYFMGTDQGSDQMVISSEAGILYAAATRAGYPRLNPDVIKEFKEGVLYTIEVKREKGLTTVHMEEEEVTLLDPWKNYAVASGWGNQASSWDSYATRGKQALTDKLGVTCGWFPATITEIAKPYSAAGVDTIKGTVKIDDNTECKFILYDRNSPEIGEDIWVYVSYLSEYGHGNQYATSSKDITVNCDDWSVVDLRGSSSVDASFSCINCGESGLTKDDVIPINALNKTEYICTHCCDSDAFVEEYANTYAIN